MRSPVRAVRLPRRLVHKAIEVHLRRCGFVVTKKRGGAPTYGARRRSATSAEASQKKSGRSKLTSLGPHYQTGRSTGVGDVLEVASRRI